MQVRWTTPAARDLEEITLYMQRDSESATRAVAKTLYDAANSLDLLPFRGKVGRIQGSREIVVPGCRTSSRIEQLRQRSKSSISITVPATGIEGIDPRCRMNARGAGPLFGG